MAIYPKVNGSYKEMATCKVKVSGAWKQAKTIYAKVNGVWKEVWSDFAIDTVINYGITNIPLKSTGMYLRLQGVTITVKSTSNDSILKTITVEDTGAVLSENFALPEGSQLSISVDNDRSGLDFEFWLSGAKAEVKIRKAELTDSR